MENFILSSPFASAGVWLIVAVLNMVVVQLGTKAYAARAAEIITAEGGPFTAETENNKIDVKQMQGLILVQVLMLFAAHMLFQQDMHSPEDTWLRSTFLVIYGLYFMPVLTAVLDTLAALWTWKYTFTNPESKISGQLAINRWHAYKQQAHTSFFSHSILFFVIFLFTQSPLLLGGTFGSLTLAISHSRRATIIANPPPAKRQSTTPRRITALLILIVLFTLFCFGWVATQGMKLSSLLALVWLVASLAVARGLGAPERWGRLAVYVFAAGLAAMYWIEQGLRGTLPAAIQGPPLLVTLLVFAALYLLLRGKRMHAYFNSPKKQKTKRRAKNPKTAK